MKRLIFFIGVFLITLSLEAAVITVNSSNGYHVNIELNTGNVNNITGSCQHGYNYNIDIHYDITFGGTNVPSSLWTLQAELICGTSTKFFDLPNNGGSGVVQTATAWSGNTDCQTATWQTLGCNTYNVTIGGPGIPNQTITIGNGTSASFLPVEFIAFNAEAVDNLVHLKWSTASEVNNEFFAIERSKNGINWNEIERIKGAGSSNGTKEYEIKDYSPLPGSSYYRIKQVDFDGSSSYSEIKVVRVRNNGFIVQMYPNPATNIVYINGVDKSDELELYSASGSLVQLPMQFDHNRAILNTSALAPGAYILRIRGNSKNHHKRLVIQH
jgi:hypothetical protein